jgi:hypothetical protein
MSNERAQDQAGADPQAAEHAPDEAPEKEPGWLAKLGPGLITGAADDDPSGIAT